MPIKILPLFITFVPAIFSSFSDMGKKWQNFIMFLLVALTVFFGVLFLMPEYMPDDTNHAMLNLAFNKITVFIGFLYAGSLFVGLYPLKDETTLDTKFLLHLASGYGLIMSGNLPTFFLFWFFQRMIPAVGFIKDMRSGSSVGGGTYIIQHFLTAVCFLALMTYAYNAGVLDLPFHEIPATFFSWPVLLLSFIIIYQSHGVFPFHSWIHDINGKLPWYEFSCLFLPRAGVLLFVQFLLPTLPGDPDGFKLLLLGLSIFSSVYWSFRGIFEKNISRTTTYFYVAQASLVLTGLQADMTAARGSYLHLLVISICGTAMYSIMSYIQNHFSLKRPSQFYGLAQYFPALATLFCLFGFAMIGVPLLASFVVEDLVINGLLAHEPYLGLGHIVATCLNGILFFLLFSKIFLGSTAYKQHVVNYDMKLGRTFPYVMGFMIVLAIGLLPFLFLEKITW
jgi:NADH:ubiquinone oxidoreductase subunit 4 (subunit M)